MNMNPDGHAFSPQSTLRRLDGDVLQVVLELLRPGRCLRPLSMTCKWLRAACAPVLFRTCAVKSDMLDRTYESEFIPCSLWPYVRNLSFTGYFSRNEIQWLNLAIDHRLDPYLLEEGFNEKLETVKQNSAALREAIGSMQSLTSIDICLPHRTDPRDPERITGISPYILEAILSTPHLRHLSIAGPLFHPRDSLPSDATCPSLAELSSFNYYYDLERSPAQVSGAEREQITRILACAHGHLEELNLPAECASIDQMGSWEWPSLRNLVLRGETVASSKPLAHMLSNMPRLRSITLFLAEPADSSHSPSSWPSSPALQLKWRDLETLDITHPHPEAEIYSHLSHNLLSLALRCWPRHYKLNTRFQEDLPAGGAQWSSPLLSSSDMLRILQRVDAPRLHDLQLEFRADYSDAQLFRHIASAFPSLKVLCIHRYRMTGETEVPLATIARSLSALHHLKLLMLHLDFVDLPDVGGPAVEDESGSILTDARARQLLLSDATLERAANTIASMLGPALDYILLLRPRRDVRKQWILFHVVRSQDDSGEAGDQIAVSSHSRQFYGGPAFPYAMLLNHDD